MPYLKSLETEEHKKTNYTQLKQFSQKNPQGHLKHMKNIWPHHISRHLGEVAILVQIPVYPGLHEVNNHYKLPPLILSHTWWPPGTHWSCWLLQAAAMSWQRVSAPSCCPVPAFTKEGRAQGVLSVLVTYGWEAAAGFEEKQHPWPTVASLAQ